MNSYTQFLCNFKKKRVSVALASSLLALTLTGTIGSTIFQSNYTVQAASTDLANSDAVISNTDGDHVRMRSCGNTDCAIIHELGEGAIVHVNSASKESSGLTWREVTYQGDNGWIADQYLASARSKSSSTNEVVNNTDSGLHLRTQPNKHSSILITIPEGSTVNVSGQTSNDAEGIVWAQVTYSAQTGWADSAYLATASQARQTTSRSVARSNSTGEAIVATAERYIGWRYIWGGSRPKDGGFDCSGLVYYALASNGIYISRSAESQIGYGSAVAAKDLQPGDVVFFANTYKRGISHVGIYIGNGRFVHAEDPATGIVVSNLWDSYFASHYYAARRMSN